MMDAGPLFLSHSTALFIVVLGCPARIPCVRPPWTDGVFEGLRSLLGALRCGLVAPPHSLFLLCRAGIPTASMQLSMIELLTAVL